MANMHFLCARGRPPMHRALQSRRSRPRGGSWFAPIEFALILGMLASFVGAYALVALGMIVLFNLLGMAIAIRVGALTKIALTHRDMRVRKTLEDPAYADWYLKFKPTGPWYSKKCDDNYDPPVCSDLYHNQEQTSHGNQYSGGHFFSLNNATSCLRRYVYVY